MEEIPAKINDEKRSLLLRKGKKSIIIKIVSKQTRNIDKSIIIPII